MSNYNRTEQETIEEELGVVIFRTADSPNWYVQFNEPGRGQRRRSLRTASRKEAKSRANRIARDLEAGAGVPRSNRAATIEAAAAGYLKYLATRDRRPKTIALNKRVFDQLAAWGRSRGITALSHLTTRTLEQFETALRDGGVPLPPDERAPRRRGSRPHKPKTIRNKMTSIKSLIKWAVQRELVAEDPARAYGLPPGGEGRIVIFSGEELELILADPDPALAEIWRFFALTGLRADELCWLTTDDLREGPLGPELLIRCKDCPQTGQAWQPKHGRERTVPLVAAAAEVARRALGASPGPWLFTAPDTQRAQVGQWTKNRLWNALKRRLAAAGIGHGTLHTFRHTFATFLANSPEVPLVHVQKVLGHAGIETTMGYVHASPADVAGSLGRVDFGRLTATGAGEAGPGSQEAVNRQGGGSKSVA